MVVSVARSLRFFSSALCLSSHNSARRQTQVFDGSNKETKSWWVCSTFASLRKQHTPFCFPSPHAHHVRTLRRRRGALRRAVSMLSRELHRQGTCVCLRHRAWFFFSFSRGDSFVGAHALSGLIIAVAILVFAAPLFKATSLILLQVSFAPLLRLRNNPYNLYNNNLLIMIYQI